MKRNWKVIAELKDRHLRTAISLAQGEVLEGFKKGFPQLFEPGNEYRHLEVSLSTLMAATKEVAEKDIDSDVFWESNFWLDYGWKKYPHLRLPIAWEFDFDQVVPLHIAKQFVGQIAKAGIRVEVNGEDFIVLYLNFDHTPAIKMGEIITEIPTFDDLKLVHAEFIIDDV